MKVFKYTICLCSIHLCSIISNERTSITPSLLTAFPAAAVTHLHWQCWQCICVVASIREAVLACFPNSAYCSTFQATLLSPCTFYSRVTPPQGDLPWGKRQNSIFRHLIQNLDTLIATLQRKAILKFYFKYKILKNSWVCWGNIKTQEALLFELKYSTSRVFLSCKWKIVFRKY